MTIETTQIIVGGHTIEIVRKAIRNLHLAVYPPNGRVRVAAPLGVDDEAVRLAVISRLGWIKRQQAKYEAQPRQSQREMISGETHYFLGRRYRLRVIPHEGMGRIVLRNRSTMELHVRPGTSAEEREQILLRWYRRRLRELIPPLLERWTPRLGVEVREWGIRRMKTKWGACSIEAGRIWLNLELVKKPIRCLEYVIVHEMTHLLERHHNERFTGHLDSFLPQWRLLREELNREPLGFERW